MAKTDACLLHTTISKSKDGIINNIILIIINRERYDAYVDYYSQCGGVYPIYVL